MEHKPATQGQVLEMIARVATQTPWEKVDGAFLQKEYISLSPTAFAEKMLQVFSVPPQTPETQKVSSIITVDRTIRPTYPSLANSKYINSPKFIALEATGPSEFDVSKLDQWLHAKQKNGVVAGNVIHDYLESNNMLEGCLGLRDLEEIQKKGIAFFRQHFKGKAVFGWKSLVQYADGRLYAPYLVEDAG